MSLRSPVPVCSNLTRPSLGENVRAESMLTVQTVLPLPLAGETVIHGSWVLATHESPLERENSTVLPSAPATIRSSGAAKPQKIDLVETFNYLIGLKVDSYVRRIDKGYCYLDGVLPSGEHTLVFWRDCDKLDAKKLNDELEKLGVDAAAKKATFDVIYVNGDHAVQNGKIKPADGVAQLKVRQIEAEFLEKMFACEEV